MIPTRLRYTYELLESYGAFNLQGAVLIEPRQATQEEIRTFHTSEYVHAVQSLGRGERKYNPSTYNFSDYGDNPVFSEMYQASLWSTGASLTAAEMVSSGQVNVAFNCSGGLHHAMPGWASGFCIFNDPVITIKYLLGKGLRVAYVDIDAHHGDGVQYAFYNSDQVLTISLHQSGTYSFPGTGFVDEMGEDKGFGYSVNVPLYPNTNDEIYIWVFDEIVAPLVKSFKPDILVTQLGMDSHFRDPIAQLGLTVQGHASIVAELGQLSSRWIAFGGGGYDISAVARGWALDFGVMLGEEWPDEIPMSYQERYGLKTLRDSEVTTADIGVLASARHFAEESVAEIEKRIFPLHYL